MSKIIDVIFSATGLLWTIGSGLVVVAIYAATMNTDLNYAMADNDAQDVKIEQLEDESHEKDLKLQEIDGKVEIIDLQVKGNSKKLSDLEDTVNTGNQQTQQMILRLEQLLREAN